MNPNIHATKQYLESILDLWSVLYDEDDEKFVIEGTNRLVLSNEQIEWINKLDLKIFSVALSDNILTIRLIDGHGC